MELLHTPVTAGISLLHSVKDGKHHYEVDAIFDDNMDQDKAFMRQGDQLLKMNEFDVQDLSPEMFVKLLTEGNVMLCVLIMPARSVFKEDRKVNHSCTEELKTVAKNPSEKTGGFRPVFKENTGLTFSMNTEQDPDLQAEEDLQEEGELETPLVVKMVSACVAQVESRTCAHGETCEKCGSTDPVQDIVIMSENVEVSRDFRKYREEQDKAVQSLFYETFLSHNSTKATLKRMRNNITICYYESDQVDGNTKVDGVPVVLNFTKTNKYLRCTRTETDVNISVTTCKKKDLEFISKDNEEMLSFVFYMRAKPSADYIFESACYEGWCVNAKSSTSVDVTDQTPIDSLYFFISSY